MTDGSTAPEQPWRDATKATEDRVDALLAAMTQQELVALALGDFAAVTHLGVPPLLFRDGPSGVRDAEGVTAFPAALAVAASFDAELAREYGAAIGEEVRAVGSNVLLGPAVDIARTPFGGRVPESFGEDPWLAGHIGAGHVRGVQSKFVIAMVKHLVANNFETLRTGDGPVAGRRDAVDIHVDARTLQEIYLAPFYELLVRARAWAVMGSYNRLNGEYPCQDPLIYDIVKRQWSWPGFFAPDFIFAVRDPAAATAAGLDLPALDGPGGRDAQMLVGAGVSPERVIDIARRFLRSMIGSGLFDRPAAVADVPASTVEHVRLARRAATEGMVLLVNRRDLLPFGRGDIRSLAVIGPAGADAIYTIGGSAGVELDLERCVTPLEGIRASADLVSVVHAQGTRGDRRSPIIDADAFTRADGRPGLRAEYFNGRGFDRFAFERTETTLDLRGRPDGLEDEWSARWTGRLTTSTTGAHRLSLLMSGEATLFVDGKRVVGGSREAARMIVGPEYPLVSVLNLQAGVSVDVCVEYTLGPAIEVGAMGLVPQVQLGWQTPDGLLPAAVDLARDCDAAVVIVQQASGEAMDRPSLTLPGDQDALIHAVAEVNPNTIVVLNTPGAVLMPWVDDVVSVLQVWYPGQQFGTALGAVLFGEEEPGGRLPVTFPAMANQIPWEAPAFVYPDRTVEYSEGQLVGYRHYDAHGLEPLFPFGHGLSYTSFSARDVLYEMIDDDVEVSCDITNTGTRSGSAVVQLYCSSPRSVGHPPQQLRSVAKTTLEASETVRLRVRLGISALAAYDDRERRFMTADGAYGLTLAWSSRSPFWSGVAHVLGGRFSDIVSVRS